MKPLRDYARQITDQVFDVICDTELTLGQTLTVLKMAKVIIDEQIKDHQQTIEEQTAPPATTKGQP